ncbi:MAG: hypothetical protein QW371_00710 [Candidatus Bathyarchaeia archaeon]
MASSKWSSPLLLLILAASSAACAIPQAKAQAWAGGGGVVWGYVYGYDWRGRLKPISWARIETIDGQYSATSMDGFYELVLPSGTFVIRVIAPGYAEQMATVAVTSGSSSSIDFYLEQSRTPIPEYPGFAMPVLMALALALAMALARRARTRRGPCLIP